jgi:hypothetical protein
LDAGRRDASRPGREAGQHAARARVHAEAEEDHVAGHVRDERPAQAQAALRRVVTLVARGAPADELVAAVPGEVGQLLQAGQTSMSR